MHIVQLLPELNQGGVERGVVELNRELVNRGHQSTVISLGGKQVNSIVQDGGNHYTLDLCSKNPLTFFARASKLRTLLKSIRPDILHARSRVPAWLTWQANKTLKLPFITTVHGFNSVNLYSAIMTKGDLVIYSSNAVKTYILENYRVDSDKLRYVPRGIDLEYFNTDLIDQSWIAQFKDKHNLHNRQIVTTVGRITAWKGQDDFIRAIAQAQKSNSAILGLIVGGVWHGKEDYLEELKNLAISCDAEIIFTGSYSQVREIYALSDLVVSPASTKPETFGRVAAEALAMNTPVIASNHGGSCDIILNKINGLLYQPGSFSEIAKSLEIAEHISFQNMHQHIHKNFSLDVMFKYEMNVYKEALEAHLNSS
jgi:glycosyltransferase involved in cell wall biosynthesis